MKHDACGVDLCLKLKLRLQPVSRWKLFGISLDVLRVFLAVVGFAGFCWNMYAFTRRVCSEPTVTRVQQHYQRSLKMPEFAICSFGLFDLPRIVSTYGIPASLVSVMHWHLNQERYQMLGYPLGPPDEEAEANDNEKLFLAMLGNRTWSNFMMEHRLNCQKFLRGCLFDYHTFNCCDYAQPVPHEKYGICYGFFGLPNGGNQTETGALADFHVVDGDIPYTQLDTGLALEYAFDYEPPYATGSYQEIRIPANTTGSISLKTKLYKRLSQAGAPCSDSNEFFCNKQCTNNAVLRFCNCTLHGLDPEANARVCDPFETLRCTHHVKPTEPYKNYYKTCMGDTCIPLCEEWVFDHRTSYSTLFVDKIIKLQKYETGDYRSTPERSISLVKIQLYYDLLLYTEYLELATFTFDNVLSELGGILHLWIGFSVMSICHVFQMVVKHCSKNKRKRTAVAAVNCATLTNQADNRGV